MADIKPAIYEAVLRVPLLSEWRELWADVMSKPSRSSFVTRQGVPVVHSIGTLIEDAIKWNWKKLRDELVAALADRIAASWPEAQCHVRDDTDPRVDATSTLVFVFDDKNAAVMFKLSL